MTRLHPGDASAPCCCVFGLLAIASRPHAILLPHPFPVETQPHPLSARVSTASGSPRRQHRPRCDTGGWVTRRRVHGCERAWPARVKAAFLHPGLAQNTRPVVGRHRNRTFSTAATCADHGMAPKSGPKWPISGVIRVRNGPYLGHVRGRYGPYARYVRGQVPALK